VAVWADTATEADLATMAAVIVVATMAAVAALPAAAAFDAVAAVASFGNAAIKKEHKLLLHPPFIHSDHLVITVQITIWAPTPFNIH